MIVIDRAELLNKLDKMLDQALDLALDDPKATDSYNSLLQVVGVIFNCKRIDFTPTKHGHWIEYPRAHYFKCSECKYIAPYKKAISVSNQREYNYCPRCGAKMALEVTNEAN